MFILRCFFCGFLLVVINNPAEIRSLQAGTADQAVQGLVFDQRIGVSSFALFLVCTRVHNDLHAAFHGSELVLI